MAQESIRDYEEYINLRRDWPTYGVQYSEYDGVWLHRDLVYAVWVWRDRQGLWESCVTHFPTGLIVDGSFAPVERLAECIRYVERTLVCVASDPLV